VEGDSPSLARGLDAILKLQNRTEFQHQASSVAAEGILEIPVGQLEPGKFQPRKHFSSHDLKELADSIKVHGILQPLIVRKKNNNLFEIIAGERRWRAAQIAEIATVPVIIKDISDAVACAFSLVENIQRKNLNPLEEAEALQRLHVEFLMSHEEIAKSVGRSRVGVTNILRLLLLDDEIKQLLLHEIITMGHARALITLVPEMQKEVCQLIIKKELSVRQTEELIRKIHDNKPELSNSTTVITDLQLEHYRNVLQKCLPAEIAIKTFADGKCHMTLKTDSVTAFQQLVERLQNLK